MSLRAKKCPYCGGTFFRRKSKIIDGEKKMVCELCEQPVHITNKGAAIKEEERACIQGLYDYFCETYMHQRGIYFGPRGGKSYMQQLGYAKRLIEASTKYLGYVNELGTIKPHDFARMVIDFIFTDPSQVWWAKKVNSLAMCNSNVFYNCAPKVWEGIKRQREEVRKETLFDSSRMDIRVMQLG